MADLTELQASLSVKLAGAGPSSGIEDNYVDVDVNGNMHVIATTAGPVTPGSVATNSNLIGGQFNTVLPTLTTGQQAALQVDSSGRVIIRPLTSADVVSAVQSGTWTVQQGSPPWTIQGDSASGAAKAGNPVQIGGVFNTTQPTVTTGQTVEAQATARGAHIVATGVDAFNVNASQSGTWTTGRTWTLASGTDSVSAVQSTSPWVTSDLADGSVNGGAAGTKSILGGGIFNSTLPTLTNGQQASLQLDSRGKLIVDASGASVGVADESAFTYGTTVQQAVGGVYQDLSPTLSAGTQGVFRLNANRAHHVTLRDPTTDVGITSDSPGNAGNQRLHAAVPDTTTASATLGALNATVQIAMAGLNGVGFQLNAGTLIGTITPELSIDGGSNWIPTQFFSLTGNDTFASLTFASANTIQILSIVLLGGTSHVRVRVSAYTSGSATSLMRAAEAAGGGVSSTFGGGSAAFGTATNTTPTIAGNTATQIISANPARKYLNISNPSGSLCYISFGNSTGLSTSSGIPIPARTFYELKGDNLFTGAIFAESSSSITFFICEGTP